MQAPLLLAILAVASAWTHEGRWSPFGVVLSLLLAALFLVDPATRGDRSIPGSWVLLPALWISLGLLAGWDRGQALEEVVLALLVLSVVAAASARPPGQRALLVFGAGLSLLALWGLWQIAVGFQLARSELGDLPQALRAAAQFRLDSGRAFASQLHPGHLAVLLATVLPLGIHEIVARRHRSFWLVVSGLTLAGLLLTRSPLGFALAVLGIVAALRPRAGTKAILAIAALAAVLLPALLLRPDLLALKPFLWRSQNWHNALWVWAGSPITGAGLGGFGQAALGVPFPVPNHPQHAHCLPLEWLAEMGIPGLIFSLLLYGWVFSLARRLWNRNRGLSAALLIIPIHNLADFSFFEPGIAVVWGLLAGWAIAFLGDEENPKTTSGRPWLPALAAILAALFFGFTTLSAFLEQRLTRSTDQSMAVAARLDAFELAPWRPFPRELAEAARSAQGETARALEAALRRARWWRPHSAALASIASDLALHRGDLPGASRSFWESRAFLPLDRRAKRPTEEGGP